MMYLNADLSMTLRRIPWFTDLCQSQLECLASLAILQELEAGEVLFHEGDREDYLYVLLEGQIVLEVEVPYARASADLHCRNPGHHRLVQHDPHCPAAHRQATGHQTLPAVGAQQQAAPTRCAKKTTSSAISLCGAWPTWLPTAC